MTAISREKPGDEERFRSAEVSLSSTSASQDKGMETEPAGLQSCEEVSWAIMVRLSLLSEDFQCEFHKATPSHQLRSTITGLEKH